MPTYSNGNTSNDFRTATPPPMNTDTGSKVPSVTPEDVHMKRKMDDTNNTSSDPKKGEFLSDLFTKY